MLLCCEASLSPSPVKVKVHKRRGGTADPSSSSLPVFSSLFLTPPPFATLANLRSRHYQWKFQDFFLLTRPGLAIASFFFLRERERVGRHTPHAVSQIFLSPLLLWEREGEGGGCAERADGQRPPPPPSQQNKFPLPLLPPHLPPGPDPLQVSYVQQ